MKKLIAETPEIVHILDFKNKRPFKTSTPLKQNSFERLAKKLETKINKIELDLKESMNILETDIKKLSKIKGTQKDLDEDMNTLSQILESRVKKSIDSLINSSHSKMDKEELKFVKNISSQLVKILSVDFYKNVIKRLKKEEYENEVDEFGMDSIMVQKIKPFFDFLYYK